MMVLLVPLITPAHAVTFGFTKITNNGNVDVGTQLSLNITAESATQTRFTFSNTGSIASSITDIYFINQAPLLFQGLINPPTAGTAPTFDPSAGVAFSSPATPANLPGAPASFDPVRFSADSDSPVSSNGINPGETLGIIFTLLSGKSFADVIAAMFAGTLQVGLHVQSIGLTGGSDSYLAATPLPGALPLFATGLACLGLLRWRRKSRNVALA